MATVYIDDTAEWKSTTVYLEGCDKAYLDAYCGKDGHEVCVMNDEDGNPAGFIWCPICGGSADDPDY